MAFILYLPGGMADVMHRLGDLATAGVLRFRAGRSPALAPAGSPPPGGPAPGADGAGGAGAADDRDDGTRAHDSVTEAAP